MSIDTLYILLGCMVGFVMAWSIGANDLANIMSTTMGSKAISVRNAIILAIVFEFAGAFWGGSHVTRTISSGIINIQLLAHSPDILIYGMLAVLFAATSWMLVASVLALPVSITNATVGSIVGFGLVVLGVHAVHLAKIGQIALSWICSPALAGIAAFMLFTIVRRTVLAKSNPFEAARTMLPLYFLFVGLVLGVMITLKGLNHFDVTLNAIGKIFAVLLTGVVVLIFGTLAIYRIPNDPNDLFIPTERMFSILMALTASAMVFAHGSNDVAIAVGPIVAIIHLASEHALNMQQVGIPFWVMFAGCFFVTVGLITYGRGIIETVGRGITTLTPSRAFCATLAAASTVIISTSIGIPVSATQTLVGAVLGVGVARGVSALNITVVRNILISWVVTIPIAATLTIAYFYTLSFIFEKI